MLPRPPEPPPDIPAVTFAVEAPVPGYPDAKPGDYIVCRPGACPEVALVRRLVRDDGLLANAIASGLLRTVVSRRPAAPEADSPPRERRHLRLA